MVTSSAENILIDGQLIKTNSYKVELCQKNLLPTSILTNTGAKKECHSIENNILIFIDHKLVEHFGIEDGTQFEQIPTSEGILLRQRKQRRD